MTCAECNQSIGRRAQAFQGKLYCEGCCTSKQTASALAPAAPSSPEDLCSKCAAKGVALRLFKAGPPGDEPIEALLCPPCMDTWSAYSTEALSTHLLNFLSPDDVETAEEQIDRLAKFIMSEVPGEPSQNEGAIDTAIRLLSASPPPTETESSGNGEPDVDTISTTAAPEITDTPL